MMDVVAVGDSVVDLVIPVPRFLRGNEDSLHSDGMERHMGGSSNYLITMSRLGLRVGVADAIGDDDLAAFYLAGLEVEGVDTSHLTVRKGGKTSGCIVILTDEGEHAYIGLEGVSRTYMPAELDEDYVKGAKAFFMSGYPLAESPISGVVLKALRAARAAGRHVFFDPSPVADTIDASVLKEAVAGTNTFILNDRELGLVASVMGVKAEPSSLLRLGAKRVVLKEGADGCSIHTAKGANSYSGFKVKVVDTTGAGDSFDAAIAFGTLRGWSDADTAALANAAGAVKVGKKGAGRNVPTTTEIKMLLMEHDNPLAYRL